MCLLFTKGVACSPCIHAQPFHVLQLFLVYRGCQPLPQFLYSPSPPGTPHSNPGILCLLLYVWPSQDRWDWHGLCENSWSWAVWGHNSRNISEKSSFLLHARQELYAWRWVSKVSKYWFLKINVMTGLADKSSTAYIDGLFAHKLWLCRHACSLGLVIISLLGRQITLTCKMYVVISINSVAYHGISSVSNAVK